MPSILIPVHSTMWTAKDNRDAETFAVEEIRLLMLDRKGDRTLLILCTDLWKNHLHKMRGLSKMTKPSYNPLCFSTPLDAWKTLDILGPPTLACSNVHCHDFVNLANKCQLWATMVDVGWVSCCKLDVGFWWLFGPKGSIYIYSIIFGVGTSYE